MDVIGCLWSRFFIIVLKMAKTSLVGAISENWKKKKFIDWKILLPSAFGTKSLREFCVLRSSIRSSMDKEIGKETFLF